jgi:hypothetical protein
MQININSKSTSTSGLARFYQIGNQLGKRKSGFKGTFLSSQISALRLGLQPKTWSISHLFPVSWPSSFHVAFSALAAPSDFISAMKQAE